MCTQTICLLLLLLLLLAQVLAAVTSDARLQIWDLDVSAIDPVINFDTDADAEPDAVLLDQSLGNKPSTSVESKPASPDNTFGSTGGLRGKLSGTQMGQSRREERDKDADKDKESPVTKLLQNLAQASTRRSLTCVLFGERSPIVVVGDNRGVVLVYRVTRPMLCTHLGPVQQMDKLREAILKQSDPMDAAKLSASGSSSSNGLEPATN